MGSYWDGVMRHLSLVVSLGVMAFYVGGCSEIKILYRNADIFAMQGIDKNMCPRGKERDAVKATLRRYLDWHQQKELPKYVDALDRIGEQVREGGLNRTAVNLVFREAELAWARLLNRAAGPFSKHLARMTPRQLDCMDAQMEKRKSDWEERVEGTEREYRKRWLDRSERMLGFLFGTFSQSQRRTMMANGPLGQGFEAKMNAHRIRASEAFADVVRSGSRRRIAKALRAVARQPRYFFSREGRLVANKDRQLRVEGLIRLATILRPSQIDFMQKKLARWSTAFRELAERAQR